MKEPAMTTTTTTLPDWPLAFGLTTINWDGKQMTLRTEAELRRDLEPMCAAGLRHVHVASFHYEEPAAFALADGVALLARLLREYGLAVSSHHCQVPTFTLPGTDQTAVRQRLLDTVALLAPLGPTALVVHPGRAWGHYDTVAEIVATYDRMAAQVGQAALIATSADNLRAMARAAAAQGQTLALENLGRWEPLGNLDTLPQLVAAIGEPNAGYCYDSGHAHAFGQPQRQWLELIGRKLFATHFHDNHGRGVTMYPPTGWVANHKSVDEHLPVGFGTIPWQEVIQQLAANGYAGVVSFETGGWPGPDVAAGYRQAIAWWRTCTQLALRGKGH
jgi:sugar phosphate isomerase/epimerase